VNTRLVVKALQVTDGRKSHEVSPASLIFSQEEEMIEGFIFDELPVIRKVKLTSDDRLEFCFLGGLVEGWDSKEVAVVRKGDGAHA
jgi:hypothetical protein